MKKIFICMISILLLTGCQNKINKVEEKKIEYIDKNEIETPKEILLPSKTFPVGLYIKGALQNNYYDKYNKFTDIGVFSTFLSNDLYLANPYLKTAWYNYLINDSELNEYRIGYKIKFSIPDRTFDCYIYRPNDVLGYFNYIQVYLYDDYHQTNGVSYSHVEDNQYNENTLLTSIKLTASVYIEEVSDEIELTTFVYKKEEIVNGEYIGDNKFTTILHRK